MRKVMVFGVFDGVHGGHLAFFNEAKSHGEYLIVAMACDPVVQKIKKHLPKYNLESRISALRKEHIADEITPGDQELSSYEVVKKYRPDVIALGYDQEDLKKDLESKNFDWRPKFVVIRAHEPEKYHSSILHGKS